MWDILFKNMDGSKKEFILKETLGYFLKYGVKNFTMDDIANKLGVSKKTLYQMFCNKENLLFEAVDELWESFLVQIHEIELEEINPLQKIVKIYDCAFQTLKTMDPVFLKSLQNYQKNVMDKYQYYRSYFLNDIIKKLMLEAKSNNQIEPNIDIDFFLQVNFENLDKQIWYEEAINNYSQEDILKYLVVYRLKGIAIQKDLF